MCWVDTWDDYGLCSMFRLSIWMISHTSLVQRCRYMTSAVKMTDIWLRLLTVLITSYHLQHDGSKVIQCHPAVRWCRVAWDWSWEYPTGKLLGWWQLLLFANTVQHLLYSWCAANIIYYMKQKHRKIMKKELKTETEMQRIPSDGLCVFSFIGILVSTN